MDDSQEEIKQRIKELELIMSQHKSDLGILEKELFKSISEYKNALKEEKIKEIKISLNI